MNQNNSSVINVNNLSSKAPVVRCVSDLVGNPEDRVSLVAAHLISYVQWLLVGLARNNAVLSKSNKSTNQPTLEVDISLAL